MHRREEIFVVSAAPRPLEGHGQWFSMIILNCLQHLHARFCVSLGLRRWSVWLSDQRRTPLTVAGLPYFTKMSKARKSFVVSDLVKPSIVLRKVLTQPAHS
jgi:hypothetical protein